jgi:hypothetical protein
MTIRVDGGEQPLNSRLCGQKRGGEGRGGERKRVANEPRRVLLRPSINSPPPLFFI